MPTSDGDADEGMDDEDGVNGEHGNTGNPEGEEKWCSERKHGKVSDTSLSILASS